MARNHAGIGGAIAALFVIIGLTGGVAGYAIGTKYGLSGIALAGGVIGGAIAFPLTLVLLQVAWITVPQYVYCGVCTGGQGDCPGA